MANVNPNGINISISIIVVVVLSFFVVPTLCGDRGVHTCGASLTGEFIVHGIVVLEEDSSVRSYRGECTQADVALSNYWHWRIQMRKTCDKSYQYRVLGASTFWLPRMAKKNRASLLFLGSAFTSSFVRVASASRSFKLT